MNTKRVVNNIAAVRFIAQTVVVELVPKGLPWSSTAE